MKCVICRNDSDKYHQTLQFPLDLLSILVSLSQLFGPATLMVWFTLTALISVVLGSNRQLLSAKELLLYTFCSAPNRRQS